MANLTNDTVLVSTGRRHGKSLLMKRMANNILDSGGKVLYASFSTTAIIERVNGVDFIVNQDGSRDIDGSNILKP